jgi:hypothetical protein
MRFVAIVVGLSLVAGCADVQTSAKSSRPLGKVETASVGDIMVKVDVSENLPNAFGKSDIFGRRRQKGFSELRYMGLSQTGSAIFRRRDVDIISNETTMNSLRFGGGTSYAQPSGSGAFVSGVSASTIGPHIESVAPDTIEITLDLATDHSLTLQGKTVDITEAKAGSVKFVVH